MVLFANLWHTLKWSDRKKAFYLGDRATEVDQYDGPDPELNESKSDQVDTKTDSSDSDEETTQAREDKDLLLLRLISIYRLIFTYPDLFTTRL